MEAFIVKIPVQCFDGILETDLNSLLKLPYFNKYLTTNLGSKRLSIIRTDGDVTKYDISIPKLEVECSMHVFDILVNNTKYSMDPPYDDSLIEFLIYNDMYMTNVELDLSLHDIKSLIHFVKEKLPSFNVYNILKRGMCNKLYYDLFIKISFEYLSEHELTTDVTHDLLSIVKDILLDEEYGTETGLNSFEVKLLILNQVIVCYDTYSEVISLQINDEVMNLVVNNMISDISEMPYCWFLSRDRWEVVHNKNLDAISDIVTKLIKIGLISYIDMKRS